MTEENQILAVVPEDVRKAVEDMEWRLREPNNGAELFVSIESLNTIIRAASESPWQPIDTIPKEEWVYVSMEDKTIQKGFVVPSEPHLLHVSIPTIDDNGFYYLSAQIPLDMAVGWILEKDYMK